MKTQFETGLEILAKNISGNRKLKVKYVKNACPSADINNATLIIPPVNNLSDKEILKTRGFFYHESMHILHSDISKPKGVLGLITNSLEDVRIESLGAKEYAGLSKIFRALNEQYNSEMQERMDGSKPAYEALITMQFKVQGIRPKFVIGDLSQKIVDVCYSDYCRISTAKNTGHVISIAKDVYEKMKEVLKEEEQEKQKDKQENKEEENKKSDNEEPKSECGEESESDNSDDNSESEKNNSEETENTEENSEEMKETDDTDENENEGNNEENFEDTENEEEISETDEDIEDKIEKQLEEEFKDTEDKIEILKSELKEIFEDKTDVNDYTSLTEHDMIFPVSIEDACYKVYDDIKHEMKSQIMGMVTNLNQAFRVMSQSHKDAYKYHGKLDMKRLVSIGKSLDKNVFCGIRPGMKLDTCVSILLDESGSMRNNIHDYKRLAITIGESLEQIGIPFEIIGHTTAFTYKGTQGLIGDYTRVIPIHLRVFKAFSEAWRTVKARCAKISANSQNVDGEALNYINERIKNRPEKRKIIFVLSDGLPQSGEGKNNELKNHLLKVVGDIRRSSTEVYAFGIQTDAPKQFYGEECFVYINNIKDMDNLFFNKFAKIITKGMIKTNKISA